jgi:DNA polymerase-4
MPVRFIAHLDMDAFFASVELLSRPDLRGLPVVVGGAGRGVTADEGDRTLDDYRGRGVVTTCTYEARRFGVHSGMGLMKAARLAPQAILLRANFDAYRTHSRDFKAAVRSITGQVEDRGIDEIYIDLTELVGAERGAEPVDFHSTADAARAVAARIRTAVIEATGLSCSIGVAPNKLLAKIASDLDKPGGLTILGPDDVAPRLWPLSVRKLNGVGPKAEQSLAALGITTVGDLATAAPAMLLARFGQSYGAWLTRAANGRDERAIVTESEPRSISRETTFGKDLHPVRDRAELSGIFTRLCQQVAADLERKGYRGRTIGIKLRFDDFRTVTRDQTLDAGTADAATIRRAAGECLRRITLDRRLRLLGVRAGTLTRGDETGPPRAATGDLFDAS